MKMLLLIATFIFTPCARANFAMTMGGAPQVPTSTVGNLPACNAQNKGALYIVTDALTPLLLSIVIAGGSVNVVVMCNGTNFVVS